MLKTLRALKSEQSTRSPSGQNSGKSGLLNKVGSKVFRRSASATGNASEFTMSDWETIVSEKSMDEGETLRQYQNNVIEQVRAQELREYERAKFEVGKEQEQKVQADSERQPQMNIQQSIDESSARVLHRLSQIDEKRHLAEQPRKSSQCVQKVINSQEDYTGQSSLQSYSSSRGMNDVIEREAKSDIQNIIKMEESNVVYKVVKIEKTGINEEYAMIREVLDNRELAFDTDESGNVSVMKSSDVVGNAEFNLINLEDEDLVQTLMLNTPHNRPIDFWRLDSESETGLHLPAVHDIRVLYHSLVDGKATLDIWTQHDTSHHNGLTGKHGCCLATTLFRVAECFLYLENSESAATYLLKCKDVITKMLGEFTVESIVINCRLAQVHILKALKSLRAEHKKTHLRHAANYYRHALETFDFLDVDAKPDALFIYTQLAVIYEKLGDKLTSAWYFKMTAELAEKVISYANDFDAKNIVQSLHKIGLHRMHTHDFDGARAAFQLSLQVGEKFDVRHHAFTHVHLARALHEEGRIEDAFKHYCRAKLELEDEIRTRRKARLHSNQDNHVHDVHRRVTLHTRVHEKHLMQALENMAQCLKELGRIDEAREIYEQGLEELDTLASDHNSTNKTKKVVSMVSDITTREQEEAEEEKERGEAEEEDAENREDEGREDDKGSELDDSDIAHLKGHLEGLIKECLRAPPKKRSWKIW